ncbi:hypothetical protein LSH36_214g05032 [Paralvinella palmiformis]|uniref:Uncharacterized protein n=1 Tax=Paralvinella palmiformis TaxID=53620 RepID=A0AAD9JPA1_9ANNE|nr:hypothetical protein LSH36_214g05032 [Paralvinella palmiformis]
MHLTIYVTAGHLSLIYSFLFGVVLPPGGAMAWPPFCPESCVCGLQTSSASPEQRRTVECSSIGLTSPPSNLTADVEMLMLGSNRIRPDSLNALANYVNMSELNIAQNHIYGLGDIKVVLSSLLYVVIDGNELDYLANKSFWWAPHLRRLSVRRNKIELIHAEAFVGLADLRILDLSDNRLFSVIPEWFRDLVSIDELDLGQNNIHVLRDGVFRLATTLRSLDISLNQLQHLYDGAFGGLKSLRKLILQGNNLKQFPVVALRRLAALREANLNRNPFQALYTSSVSDLSVATLSMSHMDRLQFIDRRAFSNLDPSQPTRNAPQQIPELHRSGSVL